MTEYGHLELPPAYRGPVNYYPKERIEALQKMLDEKTVVEAQRVNIDFAINAYKHGYDGNRQMIIQDGKQVATYYDLHTKFPWWMEYKASQLLSQAGSYSPVPDGFTQLVP
ncbi:MAG: hypothetical protein M1816_002455 [Peltula sp. TS41687]|nr:MAG: hypothetical protein M1816_002455 [Peltula sp. TS41687]